MGRTRIDPATAIWIDPSRARGSSRTLIGLRGPLGDQRMLVEIDEDHEVVLRQVDHVDAERRVDALRSPTRRLTLRRAGTVLSVLAIAVTAALGVGLGAGILRATVIQSGSMVPGLRPGDISVGVTTALRAPRVGDVVLFSARRFDGTSVAPFTHRIIGGSAAEGFITKGDANDTPEALPVRPADIRAVQILVIRRGGLLVSLRPVLIALLAVAFGALLRGDRR